MTTSFIHTWAEIVLEQVWVYRQVNELVARSIDPELLRDRQSLAEILHSPVRATIEPARVPRQAKVASNWEQAMNHDPLDVASTLSTASGTDRYVSLTKLATKTGADVARLPHTVKILLENIARRAGGRDVSRSRCRGARPLAERCR